MNEVEKMYSLANIKPLGNTDLREMKILVDGKVFVEGKYLPNNYYNIYPPFTATKQLELIKWLGIRDEFNFYQNKVTKDWVFYDYEKGATHYNFELGLASWVNYLWQDLAEEERKQIKEILSE